MEKQKICVIDKNRNRDFSDDFEYIIDEKNYDNDSISYKVQEIEFENGGKPERLFFAPNFYDPNNVFF